MADEARKQIETIKNLTDSIASQGFNSKFLSQNAKKYKSDCVSFANRLQNIGVKGKEFVKKLESEELEVAMIRYNLSNAIEALKNFQGLSSNINMFILQQQSPLTLNRPNLAEDFRIQRLLVDYNSRLDDSIECLSVAFHAMQIQKPLSIEEQEKLLRGLKVDIEKELAVLEEIKNQKNDNNRTKWLELAIEHNHLRSIPYDQIVVDKFLKCGGFGIVYKALWDDTPIVLKQLFNQTDFVEEIRLHKRVHDGDYIVKLHGITRDTDGNLGMIMKYTAHGDLRDYLKMHGSSLSWHQKIVLAKQITIGLSFIHREKIMHRDFHSGNILIDENGGPMITDFGLSRLEDIKKRSSATSQVFGLMAYTAPERLENSKYPFDERCDIYSLGVIFWEISANRRPFNGQNDISLALHLMKGKREKFTESTPPKFAELAISCWAEDPEKRPSLSQIKQTLNEILDDLPKSENNNDNLNNAEDLDKDDPLEDTDQVDYDEYFSADLDPSNYITALNNIPFEEINNLTINEN